MLEAGAEQRTDGADAAKPKTTKKLLRTEVEVRRSRRRIRRRDRRSHPARRVGTAPPLAESSPSPSHQTAGGSASATRWPFDPPASTSSVARPLPPRRCGLAALDRADPASPARRCSTTPSAIDERLLPALPRLAVGFLAATWVMVGLKTAPGRRRGAPARASPTATRSTGVGNRRAFDATLQRRADGADQPAAGGATPTTARWPC